MNPSYIRYVICLIGVGISLFTPSLIRAASTGEYRLCNNTSYIIDSAIGIEFQEATATQGWFRVYPGTCRSILSNTQDGERYFLHTRTPVIYDKMPEPTAISRMLCVKDGNFLFAGAETCSEDKGVLAPFSRVIPGEGNGVSTVTLTEEASFSSEQARIAGFQRLLTLASFDPGPIDGSSDEKTEAALETVRQRNGLAPDTLDAILFAALISTALNAAGSTGLTVCNETGWQVLAAVGIPANDSTQSQGWFRLPANRCTKIIRAELTGDMIHVFAEAVDSNGRPASVAGNLVRWDGETKFCTKSIRFNISDHKDCELRGLEDTGFRSYTLDGAQGRVIWLRENE